MTIEHTPAARKERLRRDRLHAFDLRTLMFALRADPESEDAGRAGITLVTTPSVSVNLELLEEGERLVNDQAPGLVAFQVLEGEVRLQAGDDVVYARKGELLALPAGESCSIEAVRDSSLLLTLAPEPSVVGSTP